MAVNCNGQKSKRKGNIGYYRLRGFTYSSRNLLVRFVAREGSNALQINIFTVTLGFEIAPIITRSLERLPRHKKVPPSNKMKFLLLLNDSTFLICFLHPLPDVNFFRLVLHSYLVTRISHHAILFTSEETIVARQHNQRL